MKHNPLVSIIVTTFNRKELLKETIHSIINQTFKDFELIVVDNFSDYDFFEYINSFKDNRIRPYQNSNDGIIAINRNYGIKKVKGEYIAFCDDDDLWYPDKIQKQVLSLKKSNNKMIFSMQKEFGETSIFSIRFGINPIPFRVKTSTEDLIKNNCIPLSSVLLEKSIINEVGVFNEDGIFLAVEDNELWIRISKLYKIDFLPEVLVLHRNHNNNFFDLSKNIIDKRKAIIEKHSNDKMELNQFSISRNPIKLLLRNIFIIFYQIYLNLEKY